MTVRLVFDWDPVKETAHLRKHGVRFSEAMSVFSDPFSLSKFDEEHSGAEERWITLGLGALGEPVLVVHTYVELPSGSVDIRVVSAGRPTRREIQPFWKGRQQ